MQLNIKNKDSTSGPDLDTTSSKKYFIFIYILKQNYPIDENILQICNYYNLDNSEISNDIKNNIIIPNT